MQTLVRMSLHFSFLGNYVSVSVWQHQLAGRSSCLYFVSTLLVVVTSGSIGYQMLLSLYLDELGL